MSNRYKLIRQLPNADIGAIFERKDGLCTTIDNYGKEFYLDETMVMENPEWFAPYLFTTEDGCEIYLEDKYAIVSDNEIYAYHTAEPLSIGGNWNVDGYKYFSTKEKAQEYLDSLQEFKVGDIVVCEDYSNAYNDKPLKITKIDEDRFCWFYPNYCNSDNFDILTDKVRKATDDEIISYYEQQGWVKGAKVIIHNKEQIIDKLFCFAGGIQVHSVKFADSLVNCKLIKEPTPTVGGFGYLENGEIIIP
jgi:hypothetical protein